MKKILIFILSLLPITANAHVKWFVDQGQKDAITTPPFYYIGSKEVLLWAIISIFIVIVFSVLDKIIKEPKNIVEFAKKHQSQIIRASQFVFGLFLLTVTVIWKIILIPNFEINSTFSYILSVLQILAGLLFIFNIKVRFGGLLVLILYFSLFFVDKTALLENIILPAMALFIVIKNSKQNSWFYKFDKYALELVRVCTGISLIVLAFTEKLAHPELSLMFLQNHKWNFMQTLFHINSFSNNLFVLSVGFAEMIFGIIFILGYLTSINTAVIAIFFATSVTTMFLQFGKWEVEDLVVYSVAILFIFFGSGIKKFFHFKEMKENYF
jgi:hypothetical protein